MRRRILVGALVALLLSAGTLQAQYGWFTLNGGLIARLSSTTTAVTIRQDGAGPVLDLYAGATRILSVASNALFTFTGTTLSTVAHILGSADTSGIRLDVSSGVFRVREGDNSADGPMRALSGNFTGDGVTVAGGGYVLWDGRSLMRSDSSGNWSIRNNAETNRYDITLADWGTTLKAEGVSLANASTLFLGTSPHGTLFVRVSNESPVAQYALHGGGITTTLIFGLGTVYTVTKDTASRINVYYDAAGASGAGYYLQNNRGATAQFYLVVIGA